MRKSLLAFSLVVLLGAAAANFPDVVALPSRPVMPDPLVMLDGRKITTREDWFTRRKPELKALFEHYMYGRAPISPLEVVAKVDRIDNGALAGKATKKEITLAFGPEGTPPIRLLLYIPNGPRDRVPVFVGMNFYGNHTVVNDPSIWLPTVWVPNKTAGAKENRAVEEGRGYQAETWNVAKVIDRGYALATFYCGDVAPDHPGHEDGVHPYYPGYDWGTVSAWAWGLSRAADYLVTDAKIDRTKIAVVGHSRLGKAAIVAGAFDDRFAVVIPHQAGCGGTAPSRGKVGEPVSRINTAFPHWFNAAFKRFGEQTEKLPFDQNGLAAMVAPRALLFSNAEDDTWANPEGQFEVLKAAEPVYRLLGAGGLTSTTRPESGKLSAGTLGYAIRPGKHAMTPEDWGFFLDFADKHFGRSK